MPDESQKELINDLKNWVALTQATIEEIRKDEEITTNRISKVDDRLIIVEKWMPVIDEKLKNIDAFQDQLHKLVWAIALAVLVPVVGFFVRPPPVDYNNNQPPSGIKK
jgi:hypothetical protein